MTHDLAAPRAEPTILIVDDDPNVCALLARWARDLCVNAVVATSADDALSQMRAGRFELAVCDVRMPGRDGIWLIEQLRALFPYTSIALATGVGDIDPHVSLQPGVVGYLQKPFDEGAFAAIIMQGIADCVRRFAEDRQHTGDPVRELPASSPASRADRILDGVVVTGE